MGEKPLFLAPFDSKKNFDSGLIFSSELRALLLHPRVRNSLNNEAIWQYLSLNYILTNTCIIENIVKLEPASYAIVLGLVGFLLLNQTARKGIIRKTKKILSFGDSSKNTNPMCLPFR